MCPRTAHDLCYIVTTVKVLVTITVALFLFYGSQFPNGTRLTLTFHDQQNDRSVLFPGRPTCNPRDCTVHSPEAPRQTAERERDTSLPDTRELVDHCGKV